MAYKIGEVAKLLGISSETVRYYAVSYTHLKPEKKKQKRKLTMPKKKTFILGAVGLLVLYIVVSNLTRKPPLPAVAVTPVTRGNIEQDVYKRQFLIHA